MELRSAEEEVGELLELYQSLCRTRLQDCSQEDELSLWIASLPDISSKEKNDKGEKELRPIVQTLSLVETLRERTRALEPKITRFRQRLSEKDPITDAPRYGKKTASRVTSLLESFDLLACAIGISVREVETDDDVGDDHAQNAVQLMCRRVEKELEETRRAEMERSRVRKQQEEMERAEEKCRIQEERQGEEAAQQERLRQEQELAHRAEEARRARLEAERAQLEAARLALQERERADREWMAFIPKGPDGVREQLAVLKDSTLSEPGAHETALAALHTLFSQIVSHPEEVKFRRVRRDHVRFTEDIGRHRGGNELLIAAGFRLGSIDGIPCFISTEPDIEKDMDGWSKWFDLHKATVEILEEEMKK